MAFFSAGRRVGAGLDGHQDFAQEHALFALEIVFMEFVIVLRFFLLNLNSAGNFLADHAIGEQVVLAIVLVILVGHPGLFFDELLELVGIGDLGVALDVGKLFGYFGIDVEIQFLRFGLQQKLIDALAQNVLFGVSSWHRPGAARWRPARADWLRVACGCGRSRRA